jgi:hypothetical protein
MSDVTPRRESAASLAVTRRAEEIREETGMAWERACLQAEAERDAVPRFAHIVSATALSTGQHLAMCGHVFESYRAAVSAGHPIGNYIGQANTLSSYHARGVDCEACIVRHQRAGGR